ncbi:hypothetical protein [Vibrio crassostreae]|uniref:hypothetical protein n=1 Tax=Vibrio crassostreae TaxID=246167 RepID=UPI001B30D219|nr:hypothetical protein [Vibrio crassostreae]
MAQCSVAKSLHEGFEVTLPNEHSLLTSGKVMNQPIPFKTRAGAQAAEKMLNDGIESPSLFCLYLSKREIVDNYSSANQSAVRNYYKVVEGHEDLIDTILDDWSGTEVGYSLHKCFKKDLGDMLHKSEGGRNLLNHLIRNTNVFLNAHSMSLSVI